MSWWDYGYQIAGMGNRTTLVDNNTWNNSHIALVSHRLPPLALLNASPSRLLLQQNCLCGKPAFETS